MLTPSFGLTATERVLPRLTLDWTSGASQSDVSVTRSGVATYVDSSGVIQSASADTQRIDYSLGTPGLLVEESRTNLLAYSEEFDNADWRKARASVTANAAVAPDGNTTADKFIEDSTTGTHLLFIGDELISEITVGNQYTYTFYAKAAERTRIQVLNINSSTTFGFISNVIFDLSNGTVVSVTNADGWDSFSITDAGNGWYRIQLTTIAVVVTNTFSGSVNFMRTGLVTTSTSYLGDGSSGVYIWGAQLEVGAFPTSYIPTTTATVTRAADVVKMTGTDFSDFFNASEGSFYAETTARSGDDILTAGSYTMTADATALKDYATAYSSDPSATELVFGEGLVRSVRYYPQELTAAELAAITA